MTTIKLRDKISGLLLVYFIVALVAIGSTLFVSWRLEGGAAAINDAGRERMRSYRIAYLLAIHSQLPSPELQADIDKEIVLFESTLTELARGNPHRPLFLPRDADVTAQMEGLWNRWSGSIKPFIQKIRQEGRPELLMDYRPVLERFVGEVNDLVAMVEHSNARATNLLRSLQIALVSLALIGTVLLIHFFSKVVVNPVTRLREGLARMGHADFSVRMPVKSRDEFGELADGFNKMAEQLQDIYGTLEQRVEEKTRSIEAQNRQLAALDKEMAVSEERNLLAQELHDSIAQSLAFLNIQVQMLHEDLHQGHTAEALQGLEQIREGVQESYDDVRELLVHFRTRIGDTSLETALGNAVEKFEAQTRIRTTYSSKGVPPVLMPEQVLQIMHIVQEALSNVRKHARASNVDVELTGEGKCNISIRDDGAGFDAEHDAGETHVGLRIMRERAHRIGAELTLESTPGQGTHICLGLPEKPQEKTDA